MTDFDAALRTPTFLVGAERSGTTLLRLMLDHHPAISFNPEFEYAVSQMDDDGGFPALATYHHFLKTDFIFPGAGFAVDPHLPYDALVRGFLAQKLARDGKPIIGATVHHHFDRLRFLWPEARYIHLLRDPRDVARSVIGMGWAGNTWVGAERWVAAERLWSRLMALIPTERRMDVVYEDLIREPETHLQRICSFMGTPYDPAMLDYAAHSTYDAPDPGLVFQWRKKMRDDDIALAEARCGTLLAERGYTPSGLPARTVDAAEAAALEASSAAATRRFRIKRYGLPLVLAAKLARTLRLGPLADYFQLKMNAVTAQHIK